MRRKKVTGKSRCSWVETVEKVHIDMDWVELAQYRDQWHSVMSMVMNLRVPESVDILSS